MHIAEDSHYGHAARDPEHEIPEATAHSWDDLRSPRLAVLCLDSPFPRILEPSHKGNKKN